VSFEEMIRKASERNRSKIVLALDLEDPDPDTLLQRSSRILKESGEYVCAIKINRQLVLALGLRNGVDKLLKTAHESSLPTIMDAKLNDVGHTNEFMLRSYIDAGFDAVIASPLVGWEGGLDSVFRLAISTGRAVILLVYMSNPGADAFYSLRTMSATGKPKQVFELLAEMAIEWKANGVVVGATKPEIISSVRQLAGREMAIFSPGVGAQGGDARRAVEAGSDYLIVGRSIYTDPIPSAAAKRYRDMAR